MIQGLRFSLTVPRVGALLLGGTAAHVPSMLSHSIVTIEFLFKLLRPISWQRSIMEKGFVLGHNSRFMGHHSRNIKVVFVLDAVGHMESAVMKQGLTSVCMLVLNWLSQFV